MLRSLNLQECILETAYGFISLLFCFYKEKEKIEEEEEEEEEAAEDDEETPKLLHILLLTSILLRYLSPSRR